jgi:pimeloyl-ACP methyl ester carboxylesterase
MTTWVLLRGLTREAAHWGPFVEAFLHAFPQDDVRAIDLPGAGALHRSASPLRVEDIAAEVREQLARQGAGPPPWRLVGLSLGGMVAASWASTWPGAISHCVVINTSMRPLVPWHRRLRPRHGLALASLLVRRDADAIERDILRLTSSRPDDHGAVVADWVAIRHARPVTRANAIRQLVAASRYRAPAMPAATRTLVMCSQGDRLVDPVCSQRLASRWSCELALHPQAGHDLPLDDAGWVVETIRRWCAG